MRIRSTRTIRCFRMLLAGGTLATALLLGGSPAYAQPAKDPKADRLWRARCAGCHGDDGKGQTEQGKKMGIADMTTAAFQKGLTDDQIGKSILDGIKREKGGKQQEMEPQKDKLRPDQLQLLVAYVRGLGAGH